MPHLQIIIDGHTDFEGEVRNVKITHLVPEELTENAEFKLELTAKGKVGPKLRSRPEQD